MESQTSHQNQNVINLKNLLIWLVLLSACVCQGAPAVPIHATAILNTPPGFNAGAGAGLLTDGTIGSDNWLSGGYLG